MDENTRRKLNEISGRVPSHLRDRLLKPVYEGGSRDRAEAMLHDRNTPPAKRDQIKRLLDKGAFDGKKVYEVDPKVEKQLDTYHERMIQDAVRRKEIKDPRKISQTDRMFRRGKAKMTDQKKPKR